MLRDNPMQLEDSTLLLEVVPCQVTNDKEKFLSPRTLVLQKIGGHGIIPYQKKYQRCDFFTFFQ